MVIATAIQKGGTGKTTTAAALAQAAAHKGKNVLAVDLDPQGNLTYTLAAAGTDEANSYRLLTGRRVEKCITGSGQGMDVIPASWNLQTVRTGKGTARRLRDALESVRGLYDLIIIDTPPTAGELQYNALMAADGLIIPLQADIFNQQALYQITDTAGQIRQSNPTFQIMGAVFTNYDGRSNLSRQMLQLITGKCEAAGVPILGTIRAGVAVKEAAALQVSLFVYALKSKPAQDYLAVYDRIMKNN